MDKQQALDAEVGVRHLSGLEQKNRKSAENDQEGQNYGLSLWHLQAR